MNLDLVGQQEQAVIFLLVFLRMSGFFFLFPIFKRPYCPNPVSIFLALLSALLITPTLPGGAPGGDPWSQLALLGVREVAVGAALGFLASLILVTGQVAGQFLDFQMGFFTASEVDPVMGIRVPLVGNYLYLFSMVLFLSFNGHHHLLRVMRESFTEISLGASLSPAVLPQVFSFMSWMFRAAFQISLPVLACLFVTSVALGILARTMPQLNLFVLGIPIRILVGMTMLMAITGVYASFFRDGSGDRILDLFRLLRVW